MSELDNLETFIAAAHKLAQKDDERAKLIDALEPFALYAEHMERQWGQHDDSVFYGVKRPGVRQVTYGDFRRAARLYRQLKVR